jgi:hypothetical protein
MTTIVETIHSIIVEQLQLSKYVLAKCNVFDFEVHLLGCELMLVPKVVILNGSVHSRLPLIHSYSVEKSDIEKGTSISS